MELDYRALPLMKPQHIWIAPKSIVQGVTLHGMGTKTASVPPTPRFPAASTNRCRHIGSVGLSTERIEVEHIRGTQDER
jgi:hypothetical protein